MSAALPRSKSRAIITARVIRAFAADLRKAANGFDEAAKLYEDGWTSEAREDGQLNMYAALKIAHGSWTIAQHALHVAKKSLGVHL